MRIAICWSNISGYMAACWRSLGNTPGIDLKVWAYSPASKGSQAPFDPKSVLQGIECRLLTHEERTASNSLTDEIVAHKPNLLLTAGWMTPSYTEAITHPKLRTTHKVMGLDMPWKGTARQHAACFLKKPYIRNFDTIWAAGERARQYAIRLSTPNTTIHRGLYAYDAESFNPIAENRPQTGESWPRRFLYLGRYAEVKAIDTLLEAFALYRRNHDNPWELHCCGTGPLAHLLKGQTGVIDHGFTQPTDLPSRLAESGALVLASRYEPWGVVVAEAMGSGLPVIASDACGAGVELLHPLHTGLVFPTDRANALAAAMRWIHEHPDQLPTMSRNCHQQATAYTATRWRDRLLSLPKLQSR